MLAAFYTFDKESFTILVEKMERGRPNNSTIRWIWDWLTGRIQRVVVRGLMGLSVLWLILSCLIFSLATCLIGQLQWFSTTSRIKYKTLRLAFKALSHPTCALLPFQSPSILLPSTYSTFQWCCPLAFFEQDTTSPSSWHFYPMPGSLSLLISVSWYPWLPSGLS